MSERGQFVVINNVSFSMGFSFYWHSILSYEYSNIVKVVGGKFDNVVMKFMINDTADTWKTDVNMLNGVERNLSEVNHPWAVSTKPDYS